MLSLEPATITDRRYPLLFQTGETAYGIPLVDAQHPHNFIMGLGFHYTNALGEDTIAGPLFRACRRPGAGTRGLPASCLGDGVAAGSFVASLAGFHAHLRRCPHIRNFPREDETRGQRLPWRRTGREPLDIQQRRDRLLVRRVSGSSPRRIGRRRFRPAGSRIPRRWSRAIRCAPPRRCTIRGRLAGGSWSSSLIWGRVHKTASLRNLNSYLAESVLPIRQTNFVTGRFELVDKDELFERPARVYKSKSMCSMEAHFESAHTRSATRATSIYFGT